MGKSNADTLRELFAQKSGQDLLRIVTLELDDYSPEAIEIANAEVEKRGGLEKLQVEFGQLIAPEPEENGEDVDAILVEPSADDFDYDDDDDEPWGGTITKRRKIKEETIGEVEYKLVRLGADYRTEVLEAVQQKLLAAKISANCRWGVVEVRTRGWFHKLKRDCLIVQNDRLKDFRNYVSIEPYGTYLFCGRILTTEPNFVKKYVSKKLTNTVDFFSQPRNIFQLLELNCWNAVVKDCFKQTVEELAAKLKQDSKTFVSAERKFLDIW